MPYDSGFKLNRELLNVNFQGYKLSDRHLDVAAKTDLPNPVAAVALKEGEFAYQYMRAHAFHNHLHFDPFDSFSVYWCSNDGSIKKAILEGGTISFQTVLHLPTSTMESVTNATIEFLSNTLGVVCAGDNTVAVFRRDLRSKTEEKWTILKSLEVSKNKPVMLVTAMLSAHADILCAELSVPSSSKEGDTGGTSSSTLVLEQPSESLPQQHTEILDEATPTSVDSDGCVATYKWIRVKFKINPMLTETGTKDVEGVEVLGTFQSKSLALYSAFQYQPSSKEQQLLLLSETAPLIDSGKTEKSVAASNHVTQDSSLSSNPVDHCGLGFKREEDYEWTQSDTDLTISLQLAEDVKKRDISCVFDSDELVVGLTDGTTFLQGELTHSIDPQASTWTIENHILEISLEKKVEGVTWKNIIKSVESVQPLREGLEDSLSPEELEKARKMLAELTGSGELESSPGKKACHAIQSMLEECDTSDEDAVLYVISEQCKLTQRIGLGGRQLVFTAPSPCRHPAYFSLRHDVDAVVWLPHASLTASQARWRHIATFNALGYVQASKRERKFTLCSPNLKYAVISDSTRHVFVYMQPEQDKPDCAVEYVHSVPQRTDILGIVASDPGIIYILTNKELTILRIPD